MNQKSNGSKNGEGKNYVLQLINASQKYSVDGGIKTVLNEINLNVKKGEFITLVGPSGCGKSTLLRMFLGSEKPYSGQALMHGKEILGPDETRGIVFQKHSLFPNLTVRENVVLGLLLKEFDLFERYYNPLNLIGFVSQFLGFKTRFPKLHNELCDTPHHHKRKEFYERADEYLNRIGLYKDRHANPYELSGGMQQRVSIAQTFIMDPEVLLMDECFKSLDIGTREEMQVFLLEQWNKDKKTVIFVTHDLEEALFLGTRVIVISQYYSINNGEPGVGAKIVKDIPLPWPIPAPTSIKGTMEFVQLMQDIRHEGMNPKFLQHISEFDLTHADAILD
ncbi:MAG: ABC transporter ATP-binding protein [Nanoarchaeota archaeon]|nr:ABC transporter ATP-binding protein [Nanoarchaeota archaeon]